MQVHPFLIGILSDGIIAGVGAVLTFVPSCSSSFSCSRFLKCGYMARIAFIMDRQMRSMGLSGKSIIPLVIGTGCTVPAIIAPDDRAPEAAGAYDNRDSVHPLWAKMPIFA